MAQHKLGIKLKIFFVGGSLIFLSIILGCGKVWLNVTNLNSSVPINDLNSTTFRNFGTTPISQNAMVSTYSGNGSTPSLPTSYHEVPHIFTDDDGYYNLDAGCPSNCTPVISVTGAQHSAFVNCGTSQTSIALRVADCSSKNGAAATWSGAANGVEGEATWSLVTRQGLKKEVWQDSRTGLIWSSLLNTDPGRDNWCRASGNIESTDPANYCDSPTYQPQYPIAESDCVETSGAVPTPGWCSNSIAYTTSAGCTGAGGTWTANTDNWVSGTYSPEKGGMGANSATLKVRWRLPTLADYQQAEIDGVRFVMPDMGAFSNNYEFTSSIVTAYAGREAYIIDASNTSEEAGGQPKSILGGSLCGPLSTSLSWPHS